MFETPGGLREEKRYERLKKIEGSSRLGGKRGNGKEKQGKVLGGAKGRKNQKNREGAASKRKKAERKTKQKKENRGGFG